MTISLNQNYVPFRGLKHNFPALSVAVSRSVKKSFILSSFLFSVSAFAVGDSQLTTTSAGCGSYTTPPYYWQRTSGANRNDPCDWYASSTLQPPNGTKTTFCRTGTYDTWIQIGTNTSNGSGTCNVVLQQYRPVTSCGSSLNDSDNDGICEPICPVGQTFNEVTYACVIPPTPPLSTYDNDPSGCSKAGGTFMSVGTEQVGGTSYGASFFGGKGIVLGGDLKAVTKCASTSEAVGDVIIQATGLLPLASSLIKSQLLKRLTNKNWIALLDKFMKPDGGYDFTPVTGKPQNFPDTHVDLPKLPTPSQVQSGPSTAFVREMFDRGISETPVPTVSTPDGPLPSRAPSITVAPEYQHIPDSIIPVNPTTNEPYIDYSVVDGANAIIKSTPSVSSSAPKPKLADVVPSTGTTQKPVKETIDLSSYMPDDYSPRPVIATVLQTTTKSVTFSGSDPIDKFVTDTSYPDGSSSRQTVTVNPQTGRGDISITTLSPEGVSNTTTKPFQTTNYPPNGVTSPSIPSDVTISPYPPTTSNPDGTTSPNPPTIEGGVTNTSPSSNTNPDTVSNQSFDSIINATMPTYTLPNTPDFIPFDSNPVSEMISSASEMFSNIEQQISSTKTVFDNTLALINGGWIPPVIPAGSCGDSMSFSFHGQNVDLCPPLVNQTAKVSPVVSTVVTIGGMALSIAIILGGF